MNDTHVKEFAGKTILVTGGTGTFGKAFVSKVLAIPEVKKVIVLSRDEFKQYEMQLRFPDPRLNFFLGDVRDKERLQRAFANVDIVVHAAALKQVPALEYNPLEAVKTNIYGTQNVIDAALDQKVDKVMFISTDKAVQPVNLYGSTKLCAERLVISANSYRGAGRTKFSVMRYGNVMGSRGSLIELIINKKKEGVIPLTDPKMTRFLIPINRVIDLVVEAITIMHGGEIFVPKMPSFKILDVIKVMAPEAKIKHIGIRPGEKIHELLITPQEWSRTRDAKYLYIVLPDFISWAYNPPFLKVRLVKQDKNYASNGRDFLVIDKKKIKGHLRNYIEPEV